MARKHDRTEILLDILLEFASGTRTARVSDLSLGGCFVDSIASVNIGETVRFRFILENEQWEEMPGEIAYLLPNSGFGLHFKELSDDQKKRLSDIILENGGTLSADDSES